MIYDTEKSYLGPHDIESLYDRDAIRLDFVSPGDVPLCICLRRIFHDESEPKSCGNDDPATDRWEITATGGEELSDMEILGLENAKGALQEACEGRKRMRAALATAINKLRSLGFEPVEGA